MSHTLEKRVALVTGASRGLGRAMAIALASAGAHVAVNYRKELAAANEVRAEIQKLGSRAIAVQADVSVAAEVDRLVSSVERDLGPVDILVNNAGGLWDPKEDLAKVSEAHIARVLRAEIEGMFYMIRAALPDMRRRRWGRIVNLGMERSEEFQEPPYDYTVGKIARHGLTRILSEVEMSRGITINAILPGYIPHFSFRNAVAAVRHEGPWKPRRHGTPQDVAELVAWLCTEEARFVKGALIPIHGAPMDA